MKKLILTLTTSLLLGLIYSSSAHAGAMTSEQNSIAMNVAYAEEILYCNSDLGFSRYENAQLFDNNGSCIDSSELFGETPSGLSESASMVYQGGVHRWVIAADNEKTCWFFIYHGDPDPDSQVLAWDTFFTACSVLLNQPVSDNWVMFDFEYPETSPVFARCPNEIVPFTGYENNCLEFSYGINPLNNDVQAGTAIYINKAANILKKKFYASSKGWLTYNRKTKQMSAVVSKSPAGAKVYIQKWVDYKWVDVYSGERFWEGRSTVFYNKASAGKYRIFMKSVTGQKFISKTLVV